MRRRCLLQGAGAALGAGALSTAAGLADGDAEDPRLDPAPGAVMRDHRVTLPSSTPRMVIARGPSPERNVGAALARLGGMSAFVARGDVVLVKPNIGWNRAPKHAANTHPDVVATLVKACVAAGAQRVMVTDCPVHSAHKTFPRSGIAAAARQAGGTVVRPDQSRFEKVRLSAALGSWQVLEPFVSADKIINVPIVKHHGSSGMTAGMKNWFGITNKGRGTFHGRLQQTIAELAALMRPTLTVLDATRILLRNGPKGGNLADVKRLDTIVMSIDPVAADAWAAEILKTPSSHLEALRLAEGMKLGVMDYRSLKPVELTSS